MIDRIAFFDSISGIKYPDMLVEFFDQFIALKQLVEDYGIVTVDDNPGNYISFRISFDDVRNKEKALNNVQTGNVYIYGRPVSVQVQPISETEIKIILQ